MDAIQFVTVIISLALPPSQEAGFFTNDNFAVLAPSKEMADEIIEKAGSLRARIAHEWLGKKLEEGVGRAVIQVKLSDSNEGNTWVQQPPIRTSHVVSISATRVKLNAILAHEIVHVIFLTHFPERFPVWAEEGVACLQEDSKSRTKRLRIAQSLAATIDRVQLETLFRADDVLEAFRGGDSVAASLVEFFLSRGDQAKFVAFATCGKTTGWEPALRQVYQISSVNELLSLWREWIAQPTDNKRIASGSSKSG